MDSLALNNVTDTWLIGYGSNAPQIIENTPGNIGKVKRDINASWISVRMYTSDR